MVFNVLAVNKNDHVKNISFLMNQEGQWSLSPMYDVTFACEKDNYWISHHQMLINGKRDNYSREDLLASARIMDVKEKRAIKIIEAVEGAIHHFPEYGQQASLSKKAIRSIQEEMEAVAKVL